MLELLLFRGSLHCKGELRQRQLLLACWHPQSDSARE
jgi:hypothetical protein